MKPKPAKARVEEKEDVVGCDPDDEEKRHEVKDRQPLIWRQFSRTMRKGILPLLLLLLLLSSTTSTSSAANYYFYYCCYYD